jgi:hypothetical protein
VKKSILFFLSIYASLFCNAQWQQIGPNGGDITALAVKGSNIFAAVDWKGVYLSTDKGVNWTLADSGLPSTSNITSFAVCDTCIFAGTAGHGTGVFRSTDNGTNWTAVNAGLNEENVSCFAVKDSKIFKSGDYINSFSLKHLPFSSPSSSGSRTYHVILYASALIFTSNRKLAKYDSYLVRTITSPCNSYICFVVL